MVPDPRVKDHKADQCLPVEAQRCLGLQNVPYRALPGNRNEELSYRPPAIQCLSGFMQAVPKVDLFEDVIGNRRLCHCVGTIPDQPAIRGEDPKRIGHLAFFIFVSNRLGCAHRTSTYL